MPGQPPWFIRTGAFPWSSERVPVVDHYTSLKVQPQSISAKHQVLLKQTQRNQGKCPSPLRGCHGNTETNRGTLSGDPLAYFACHLGFSLFCFWVCLGPLWCPVPRTKLASKIGETHTHTHRIGAWGLRCIACLRVLLMKCFKYTSQYYTLLFTHIKTK